MAKRWTEEEIEYLETHWGTKSIKQLAKHLDRTETAVQYKGLRMGLGGPTLASGRVTANQLATITGVDSKTVFRWFNRGLPYTKKSLIKMNMYYIEPRDFWKWAKTDKFVDFRKIERGLLLPEPDWLDERILKQIDNTAKRQLKKWTQLEDTMLINLMQKGHTQEEIARMMERTRSAVGSRIKRLYETAHKKKGA